ncbi:Spore germination protein B1 [Bacillus paralicheniformis]|nr:spore germination protein [Bacillus paralicheniformis]TWM36258.1 Spore germination protein B1 [Bacillus paralicheniformis]WAJ16363.1 spore germination protein [Bacillus paralicheniformis]
MFRKYKRKGAGLRSAPITKDALLDATAGMADAVIEEHETKGGQKAVFYYLHTIIDRVMLQQSIIRPLIMSAEEESIYRCLKTFVLHVEPIVSLETAKEWLMSGSIIIHDPDRQQWFAIPIENRVGRQIEPSQTETVMYGPKDSFTEQLDVNLSLLRRRLPLTNLKAERLTVCSLSKTSVVIVYIAGLTNPELIEEARKKSRKPILT